MTTQTLHIDAPSVKSKARNAPPTLQALLAVLVSGAVTYQFVLPEYHQLKAQQDITRALQERLNSAEQKEAQLPALRDEQAQLQQDLQDFMARFPASEDTASLVRLVQRGAQTNTLHLASLTRSVEKSPVDGIDQVSLQLKLDGTFPSTYRYLQWLNTQQRFLSAGDLNMTTSGSKLSVTTTITGYVTRAAGGQP